MHSGQRVQSREQVQPFIPKRAPAPQAQKTNGNRPKAGFTISSPGDNDDDDEWESSESGAATPNIHESDSESESDDSSASAYLNRHLDAERSPQTARPVDAVQPATPVLPRVDTARPSDYGPAAADPVHVQPAPERLGTRTPTLPPIKTEPPTPQHTQIQNYLPSRHDSMTHSPSEIPSPGPNSRPTHKRHSSTRPPSTHSVTGRSDPPLRPHPLIRGHSYGHVYPQKPAPLAPLTVIPDSTDSISTSPPSVYDGAMTHLSTSPSSSLKTTLASPASPDRAGPSHRRTSVSSARSVATLPVSNLRESVNWGLGDRKRTLSSISHSSSSAALSSLVHLPAVTRPPSPQAISFFPPVNPHANIEGIHPLLPGPYLNNHLTVLARRTPIKESFDRVIRAKQIRV